MVQYFRPWGRDFTVLRLVSRKFKAAYTDHLKSVSNIGTYLSTVQKKGLDDATESLDHLFQYILEGTFYDKDELDWQGKLHNPKFLMEQQEEKFVEELIKDPFDNAVEESKQAISLFKKVYQNRYT